MKHGGRSDESYQSGFTVEKKKKRDESRGVWAVGEGIPEEAPCDAPPALPTECCVLSRSVVSDSAIPGTVARQAPLSTGILRARILEWLDSVRLPGYLPNPGIEPTSAASPVLQVDSLPAEPSGKHPTTPLDRLNFTKTEWPPLPETGIKGPAVGTSLVVQWLGLSTPRAWIQSLVGERDLTCHN